MRIIFSTWSFQLHFDSNLLFHYCQSSTLPGCQVQNHLFCFTQCLTKCTSCWFRHRINLEFRSRKLYKYFFQDFFSNYNNLDWGLCLFWFLRVACLQDRARASKTHFNFFFFFNESLSTHLCGEIQKFSRILGCIVFRNFFLNFYIYNNNLFK